MGAPLRKTRFLLSLLLSVFQCLAAAQTHSWVLEEYKAGQVNATHPLLIWTIIQGTSEKPLNKPWVHCKLLLSLWTGCWQGWTSLSWVLSLLRVNAAAPGMTLACGWDHFAPSSSVSTSISTPTKRHVSQSLLTIQYTWTFLATWIKPTATSAG